MTGFHFTRILADNLDFGSAPASIGFLDDVVVEFGQIREMVFAQHDPLGHGNPDGLQDFVFLTLTQRVSAEEPSAKLPTVSDERRRKNEGWIFRQAKVQVRHVLGDECGDARIKLLDVTGNLFKTLLVESAVNHDHQIASTGAEQT